MVSTGGGAGGRPEVRWRRRSSPGRGRETGALGSPHGFCSRKELVVSRAAGPREPESAETEKVWAPQRLSGPFGKGGGGLRSEVGEGHRGGRRGGRRQWVWTAAETLGGEAGLRTGVSAGGETGDLGEWFVLVAKTVPRGQRQEPGV